MYGLLPCYRSTPTHAFTVGTCVAHCTPIPRLGRRPLIIELRRTGGSGGSPADRGGRNSRKGDSYESKNRRRGRPAWQRSPDDSPLRDGNRDRLIGLLTERAAKTLLYYLSETNLNVYHWFGVYIKENPIPRNGHWDDVSGETFLRNLLSQSISEAKYETGRAQMYDCTKSSGVDPRNIAQRVMEIRTQVAKEMTDDLRNIAEENALLMRESLTFAFSLDHVVDHPLERKSEPNEAA